MAQQDKETAKLIADTRDNLLPLYSDVEEDRPDSVLSSYPNADCVVTALKRCFDLLFPGRNCGMHIKNGGLSTYFESILSEIWELLYPEIIRALPFRWMGEAAQVEGASRDIDVEKEAKEILTQLFKALPRIRELLIEDVRAAYEGDPAALSFAEVKIAYPGLLAIASHRVAHELYKLNVPIVPRIMSEWTHTRTGCDIHPGAKIGKGFFVDHPTGAVIGETAELGERVKLYQGVTIGAKSFPLDKQGRPIKHIKRHPTLGDNVVIYANATILGGDTVIGEGSIIGGNVFLMESVPPGSRVVRQSPDSVVKKNNKSS